MTDPEHEELQADLRDDASEGLTFASYGIAGVHYARCWPCQLNQCPGGLHGWADLEDVKHALATGQADPSGLKCGCPCANGPVLEQVPDEPDLDEESLDLTVCELCGESGACGYDAEGRPMIHAWAGADEDDDSRGSSVGSS